MDRPAILFVHGMWGRPSAFDGLRARLPGWETHAPALPFHDLPAGSAAPAALGTLALRDYVDAVVAHARALPRMPVLAGHSMGGLIAQLAAAQLQPPALVLLAPAPAAGISALAMAPVRTNWSVVSRPGWWRRPTRIDAAGARWGIYNGVPDAVANAEFAGLTWDSGRVLAQIAFPWADAARGAKVDHARLTMPALVVQGDVDRIVPVAVGRATARKLPGAVRYEELAGTGHWLFHEPVVDRLAGLLNAFLTEAMP